MEYQISPAVREQILSTYLATAEGRSKLAQAFIQPGRLMLAAPSSSEGILERIGAWIEVIERLRALLDGTETFDRPALFGVYGDLRSRHEQRGRLCPHQGMDPAQTFAAEVVLVLEETGLQALPYPGPRGACVGVVLRSPLDAFWVGVALGVGMGQHAEHLRPEVTDGVLYFPRLPWAV